MLMRDGISRRRVSMCVSVCRSVRLSVTRRYCIKTAKRRITQTTPNPSTPFRTPQFRPIYAYSASTMRAGEKSYLFIIYLLICIK